MASYSERDLDILSSILDHCDRISDIVARFGKDYDTFSNDVHYQDAIMMNLFQIGESSNSLSEDCKETMKSISWRDIYGTRNIIAHAYVKVDLSIIWNTVLNDIPVLADTIKLKSGLL